MIPTHLPVNSELNNGELIDFDGLLVLSKTHVLFGSIMANLAWLPSFMCTSSNPNILRGPLDDFSKSNSKGKSFDKFTRLLKKVGNEQIPAVDKSNSKSFDSGS